LGADLKRLLAQPNPYLSFVWPSKADSLVLGHLPGSNVGESTVGNRTRVRVNVKIATKQDRAVVVGVDGLLGEAEENWGARPKRFRLKGTRARARKYSERKRLDEINQEGKYNVQIAARD